MKRIVALILAAVMIFSMTACGEKKLSNENANMNTNETKTNEKTYTLDDLAIRDKETGKLIRIGDKREEVEKIVGEPENKDEYDYDFGSSCYYKNNLIVIYDEDQKAVDISCNIFSDDEIWYELASGIGFDSDFTDFRDEYPGASILSDDEYLTTVGLPLKKGKFKYKLCDKNEFDFNIDDITEKGIKYSEISQEYASIRIIHYKTSPIKWIAVSAIPTPLK